MTQPFQAHQRTSPAFALALALLCAPAFAQTNTTDQIIDRGEKRTVENRSAQQQIDTVHEQTLSLIDSYESNLKIVDGLHTYNAMLQKQLDRQQREMADLRTSITDVAVIERQILPLLSRMLDGLDEFIALDVPFLSQERQQRVQKLRAELERVDVTAAEKARRVFEAYQIENEYGRTIEAYRGKLTLGEASYDVDFLRIGRIALLYRTVGGQMMGMWDNNSRSWQAVPAGQYRRHFEQGFKIARQEMAPELISVPLRVSNSGGAP